MGLIKSLVALAVFGCMIVALILQTPAYIDTLDKSQSQQYQVAVLEDIQK